MENRIIIISIPISRQRTQWCTFTLRQNTIQRMVDIVPHSWSTVRKWCKILNWCNQPQIGIVEFIWGNITIILRHHMVSPGNNGLSTCNHHYSSNIASIMVDDSSIISRKQPWLLHRNILPSISVLYGSHGNNLKSHITPFADTIAICSPTVRLWYLHWVISSRLGYLNHSLDLLPM